MISPIEQMQNIAKERGWKCSFHSHPKTKARWFMPSVKHPAHHKEN